MWVAKANIRTANCFKLNTRLIDTYKNVQWFYCKNQNPNKNNEKQIKCSEKKTENKRKKPFYFKWKTKQKSNRKINDIIFFSDLNILICSKCTFRWSVVVNLYCHGLQSETILIFLNKETKISKKQNTVEEKKCDKNEKFWIKILQHKGVVGH